MKYNVNTSRKISLVKKFMRIFYKIGSEGEMAKRLCLIRLRFLKEGHNYVDLDLIETFLEEQDISVRHTFFVDLDQETKDRLLSTFYILYDLHGIPQRKSKFDRFCEERNFEL